MTFFLFCAACLCFALHPAGAGLALRCGLEASLRFSPRAALALSAAAGLSACLTAWLGLGGLRAVPSAQRRALLSAALIGGTLGRMLALMLAAGLPSSRDFGRAQALPLLGLTLLSFSPARLRFPRSGRGLLALSLGCAFAEGFFGAGGLALFALTRPAIARGRRGALPAGALLLCAGAQAAALLLTALSGAPMLLPARLALAASLGASVGAVVHWAAKQRGAPLRGMRAALYVYAVLAALACAEQAFL